jgi:Ala-tRNA(Pro) deacylase
MAIPRDIKQYMFHNNVSYVHKTHLVAYRSQDIAQIEHIPGREFAKTVVLCADENLILAVLPGDHIINLEALRNQVGCRTLSLPPESEFAKDFPGCQPGAMPPFGMLFGLPLYCDSALAKQAEIEFNAGTHVDTIRMTYPSFIKLENPLVLSFSEKRTGYPARRVA